MPPKYVKGYFAATSFNPTFTVHEVISVCNVKSKDIRLSSTDAESTNSYEVERSKIKQWLETVALLKPSFYGSDGYIINKFIL